MWQICFRMPISNDLFHRNAFPHLKCGCLAKIRNFLNLEMMSKIAVDGIFPKKRCHRSKRYLQHN